MCAHPIKHSTPFALDATEEGTNKLEETKNWITGVLSVLIWGSIAHTHKSNATR